MTHEPCSRPNGSASLDGMSRSRGSLHLRAGLAVVILTIAFGAAPARAGGTDRLPDLRMANLTDIYTENSGGQRRLRFTTIMTNEGAGPLEVHGSRQNLSQPHMTTSQRIYNTSGGSRMVPSRALMEYAEDGHDHWHIQGVMLYQIWSADGVTRRGTKVGFCFLDSMRMPGSLPGTPSGVVYRESRCGDRSDLTNSMGLSVGYGDEYPADFAFQWIDISTLPPGDYVVQARADEQNWYVESNEGNNCAYARIRIAATNGPAHVYGRDRGCMTPPVATAPVERQYGNDRYETAAAASEDAFNPGVPVAYVATGANYPDALAAGAAAGHQGGPVLLVERNRLPALAITELERLDPHRIVVVGSSAVVSDYVLGLLSRFHVGGGVERIAGPDRYETATRISFDAFASGVATVYVASGLDWPDALAAVPQAARTGSPLLLTRPDRIPPVVRQELQRLAPQRIIVLGGPSAVSEAVAAELGTYATAGSPIRLAGTDRYGTALAIARFHHESGASIAYVATGLNYPDALAAGPVAARRGGPTILVRQNEIPTPSRTALDELGLDRIIVLGGPSVVSMGVQNGLAAYAGN